MVIIANADSMKLASEYNGSQLDSLREIIFHPEIPFVRKIELLSSQSNLAFYTEHVDLYNRLLRNLSIEAFMHNDSTYIDKSISKLKELIETNNTPVVTFFYLKVTSALFNVYYHYSKDAHLLDSTEYYLRKCLAMYDKDLLPKSLDNLSYELYALLAETISLKNNPDFAAIDSLLSIALKYDMDSLGMARIYQTKARYFIHRSLIDSAEVMALLSQSFLETGYQEPDYLVEKQTIEQLRTIYEIKGDYKKMIEYNNLWDKKTEEIRVNEVKKLELQFEAEMKESELKQLYAEKLYQENRFKLSILACALLCLTILFLFFYLQLKKRNLNSQLALIAAQREETKLKVKLKEEQTVKMQLEKFMVLSDFRLKELELIGKTIDMEQLYKDKEELDKQVELFRQKVEAFESSIEKDNQEESDVQQVIVEDLRRLFSKQKSIDPIYLQKLDNLNTAFIDKIRAQSKGNLSTSHLKYCVCFAIDLGMHEISECFNIEQTSVHMIRYRLKKKFELSNDDDLDQFLQTFLA